MWGVQISCNRISSTSSTQHSCERMHVGQERRHTNESGGITKKKVWFRVFFWQEFKIQFIYSTRQLLPLGKLLKLTLLHANFSARSPSRQGKCQHSNCRAPHIAPLLARLEWRNCGTIQIYNILIYIQQDATLHGLFHLETALHFSGVTSTHH